MSIPFSLVKQPLLYPTLDPTHQYVKASNIVRHGDGSGSVNGVQTYAVKMLANQGTCGVTVQALSGQNIITAFTLSRDALLTWINSAGSNTTNIVTQTVGAIPYNKVLDSPTKDQYAWFAIGVDGHINTATPFPDNTYSYSISGNFLSPESIMKYENGQGAPKTGTFLNPSLILPNSENTFNSIYGDCISGSYYMTFDVSANIQKTITITPSNSTPVGLAISSSKSDLSSWIHNGGVGSLTDGGSYVAIGGSPLDIPIVLYESKTMYAVYYNPGDIGGSTCQTGIPVTITSAQDIEQGSNLGTFANPYIIANNLAQSSATQHDFSQGECTKGAVYYELLACASPGYLSVGVSRGSTDYDMGVAIDADKNNLANYLRTGNSGLIANVVTISNGMGDQGLMSMVIPPSDHTYYIMIFDWAALGNEPYNTCANFDRTFTVFTEQLNCGGGGSGADGTYNHPFVDSQTWGTYRVHKEGDCSQGLTWFTWGYWCNNAPVSLGIEPQNGQNVGVAWGTDQAAVLSWVNANGAGGGGGGGGGVCGYFTNSGNNYDDQAGNYYFQYTEGWWQRYGDYAIFETLNLPNYCGPNCGHFDQPSDPQNSAYYDYLSNTYNNTGFDSWYIDVPDTTNDRTTLPNYCADTCGFFADQVNFLTADYYVDSGNTIYTNVSSGLWHDPINDIDIDQASLPCGGNPDCGCFSLTSDIPNSYYYDAPTGQYYNLYNSTPGVWFLGTYTPSYYNGIETLPDYCVPGSGGGGGGVVHHMTTSNDGTYVNYSGYGVNSQIYAVVYLPDSFPSDQCFNTDTYRFGMNRNYCEQFDGTEGAYVGQNTNPFVIANNQNMSKLHNAGECAYGSVFFQVDVCQTQVFTITVSNSPRTVGIAWATDIVVLYNWITSGGESSGVNLGSYDGGFQSAQMGGTEASFSPATNNVYYFVVYDVSLQNTCSVVDQSFDIATSQSSCDGANGATGSYDSPITVGSTDDLSVGANYGNCFSGETFFTMQMCPNISGSVRITPSSNSYPQAIFYASNKSIVKQMADYYVSYGGGIGWGGYYDEGYNTASSTTSSPLVTIIPSHNTLKTMYFALTDRYPAASIPRCSRTGNVGVTTFQSCPIVNIGGTANISGAKRYNFDPFNYQSTIKTGVTLVTGDLGVAQTVNFLYSPMLIIDHPDEYPTITCSNISVVLYGNDVDGTTRTLDTQSTIKTEVILKNNKAIIKPTITNELLFNSANFYTGLAQTTYTTNIGTIIRNQVINVGDRFDASREQYAYVTSVSGNVATVFIPVVDESVHTLLNTEDVTSYTYNSPNSYVITFNKTGVITLPFNRAGKGTQSIKVKL